MASSRQERINLNQPDNERTTLWAAVSDAVNLATYNENGTEQNYEMQYGQLLQNVRTNESGVVPHAPEESAVDLVLQNLAEEREQGLTLRNQEEIAHLESEIPAQFTYAQAFQMYLAEGKQQPQKMQPATTQVSPSNSSKAAVSRNLITGKVSQPKPQLLTEASTSRPSLLTTTAGKAVLARSPTDTSIIIEAAPKSLSTSQTVPTDDPDPRGDDDFDVAMHVVIDGTASNAVNEVDDQNKLELVEIATAASQTHPKGEPDRNEEQQFPFVAMVSEAEKDSTNNDIETGIEEMQSELHHVNATNQTHDSKSFPEVVKINKTIVEVVTDEVTDLKPSLPTQINFAKSSSAIEKAAPLMLRRLADHNLPPRNSSSQVPSGKRWRRGRSSNWPGEHDGMSPSKQSLFNICNDLEHDRNISELHSVFEEHPKPQNICQRPIGMSTIKEKIASGAIRTIIELQRDLMLLGQNAMMLSAAGSKDHESAKAYMLHLQDLPAFKNNPKTSKTQTKPQANNAKKGRKETKSVM